MKKIIRLQVSLCLEFKTPKMTKVKAHQRIQKGRVVKVHSFFRRLRDLR